MSTAATTQHRFSDPLAMAAAVVVIIGGATVIGVAATQDSTTTPSTPTAPAQAYNYPGGRIGLGDFTLDNTKPNRGDYAAPPQGGAPGVSRGDYAAPPQGGAPGPNTGDNSAPPPGGHPMVGLP